MDRHKVYRPLFLLLLLVACAPSVPLADATPTQKDGPLAIALVREWLAERPTLDKNSSWDCLDVHTRIDSKAPFTVAELSPGVYEVRHETGTGSYRWMVYVKEQVIDPVQRPDKAGIC